MMGVLGRGPLSIPSDRRAMILEDTGTGGQWLERAKQKPSPHGEGWGTCWLVGALAVVMAASGLGCACVCRLPQAHPKQVAEPTRAGSRAGARGPRSKKTFRTQAWMRAAWTLHQGVMNPRWTTSLPLSLLGVGCGLEVFPEPKLGSPGPLSLVPILL
jgi:hypothetical protein